MPKAPQTERKKLKIWAILFWLLLWQGLALWLSQDILLVSPVSVLIRLVQLVQTAAFWRAVLFSAARIIGGFLLALLSGILLAVLSARHQLVADLLSPLISVVKSIPVASFVILSLVWISARHLSVWIAFLMVLPIVTTHLQEGIAQMDPDLVEMARVYRLTPLRRFRAIYLSQVLPYVRSACVLALGLCWKSGVAAEVIGLPSGSIGANLYNAKIYLDTPDLFAWTLVIVLLSYSFEKLFLGGLSTFARRLERAG